MSNILILTESVGHAAALNTKSAFESFGHTVTASQDFSTSTSAYDLICLVRVPVVNYVDIGDYVKSKISGSVPLFLGLTQTGLSSTGTLENSYLTRAGLIGGYSQISALSSGSKISTQAHPILLGIAPGTDIDPYLTPSWSSSLHAGAETEFSGVKLADNLTSGRGDFFAIDAGTVSYGLADVTTKVVIADFLYGAAGYSLQGTDLLQRSIDWLLAPPPPVTPPERVVGVRWPNYRASSSGGDGGSGGGGFSAGNFVKTTESLAPFGYEFSTFDMNAAEVQQVLRLTADRPCRVRFYASAAHRAADLLRASGNDPRGDHGVLLDSVLGHGELAKILSPVPSIFNTDGFPGSFPITINNTDGTYTGSITVTALVKGIAGSAQGGSDATDYFKVTPSLANGAHDQGAFTLGASELHLALRISSDVSSRVRFYATEAQRISDLGRAVSVDPIGNHGLLLEAVLTPGKLTYIMTPATSIFNSSTFGPVPVTITNLSGSATPVSVTLTAKGI